MSSTYYQKVYRISNKKICLSKNGLGAGFMLRLRWVCAESAASDHQQKGKMQKAETKKSKRFVWRCYAAKALSQAGLKLKSAKYNQLLAQNRGRDGGRGLRKQFLCVCERLLLMRSSISYAKPSEVK